MDVTFLPVGADIELDVHGIGSVHGVLRSTSDTWLEVEAAKRWIIPLAAVDTLSVPHGGDVSQVRPLHARTLDHALRELLGQGGTVVVYLRSGTRCEGAVVDVGGGAIALGSNGRDRLIPIEALAACVTER